MFALSWFMPQMHDFWGKHLTWQVWLQKAARYYDLDINVADAGTVYLDGNLTLAAYLAGEGVALLPRGVALFQLRARTLISLSNIGIREDESYLVLTPTSRPVPHSALIFAQRMQSLPGTIKLGVPKS